MTEPVPETSPVALELSGIHAGYGRHVVVRDVTLRVPRHGIVALIGANGAGKTTLMRVASGLLRPRAGTVRIHGDDMTRAGPSVRARHGLCLIPEGRGIFRTLTVKENLVLHMPPWQHGVSVEQAVDAFPALGERLSQTAGSLSGGEQQMLALARVSLARPQVVLVDEVSMGLAPMLVDQIFQSLQSLAQTGIALLIVEQYVRRALEMCDYVYLLSRGTISYEGETSHLDEAVLMEGYLGGRGA